MTYNARAHFCWGASPSGSAQWNAGGGVGWAFALFGAGSRQAVVSSSSVTAMFEFPEVPVSRFERIADELAERGWSVQEQLLPEALAQALGSECRALWQQADLTPAAIGRGAEQVVVPRIRGDYTRWLDDCPPCAANTAYLALMAELRSVLNRSLFLGLDSFETHYALYPPGAGYQRHLDRFADSPLRTISVVSYLNHAWQPGDGGELRLHLDAGMQDFAPRAGTVAIFTSADIEHEVLAAAKERASLAGWFRRRPDNPLLR
ncbi:2OG-Fe(II) oxygenase [Pseudomonas neustonica]|uniref:2OG-Fe(II) oxygenase n=1 Tax=Pseudomonas TaxID=286 RepID=UPI0026D9ED33|nr:2OG-Fe(II) oxygenase [Pseudomonas sp. 5Ae-yellow]|tara:strand:- start:852 stop:1637 length:786 start_codon:yes stop_codon:yes gene_type:complete